MKGFEVRVLIWDSGVKLCGFRLRMYGSAIRVEGLRVRVKGLG